MRQKEKECLEKAKAHLGQAQAHVIFTLIYDFIMSNMFIPCWREMKQVFGLCEKHGKCGANEKDGVVQLRLKCGSYRQVIQVRVPPSYPEEGVAIEFQASDFPHDVQVIFSAQADEISRRCAAGFSPEQALQSTRNPDAPMKKTITQPTIRLNSENLHNLKHDVNVLKQMADLRQVTQAKDKRNQFSSFSTSDRREARKDLRRLAKEEAAKDEAQLREWLEQERAEMESLMKTKVSDTAQPSLLAVCSFLIEEYVARLPREPCQACGETVFPTDPNHEALTNPQSERRPMRTYCGHWLHYDCLNTWLTTPPFARDCPVCSKRIWHPDWPSDVKQLERAWQTQEARKREMADVADFLDL